jgi:hypothetical protein
MRFLSAERRFTQDHLFCGVPAAQAKSRFLTPAQQEPVRIASGINVGANHIAAGIDAESPRCRGPEELVDG